MINKLKNKSGSTFLFTLFLLALVGIITTVLYGYVITQTKVTKKTQDDIEDMYIAQGGVERATSEFISSISIDPPTDESVETETPNYIATGTISRRVGRYVRSLVDEVGIINGNFKYKTNKSSETVENDSATDWKDSELGSIMNKNDELLESLNEFNTINWYVDSEQAKSPNKWIKNQSDLNKANKYLNSISSIIEDMKKHIESENIDGLNNNQISYIKNNITTIERMIGYIRTVMQKQSSKLSGISTYKYYDYEHFITPTDKKASTLDETINSIQSEDIGILRVLIQQSAKNINSIPKLVTNTDDMSGWERLYNMNSNLSSNNTALLEGIELDLARAKSNDYSKEEKMKWVVSASIKLNKLVTMIGDVSADQVLQSQVYNHFKLNESYNNGITTDKMGFARVTIQNAKRSIKAAQIACDYLQYKLGKGVLNLYKENEVVTVNGKDKEIPGILRYAYENLDDIQIVTNIGGKETTSGVPKLIMDKLNVVSRKLDELNEINHYEENHGEYYLETYDKKVKSIISTSPNDKKELALVIENLQELYDRVSMSNNEDYNSTNTNAEILLNNVINNLKNIEVILNSLVLNNEYTNTSFTSKNNVTVNFDKDINISQDINDRSNSENTNRLGVVVENVSAKVMQPGNNENGYDVSSTEIERERISLNPDRNLEFKLKIDSSVNSGSRSRLKIDVDVDITNIDIIKGTNNKPISVDYDISYKILGMSEGR